MTAPDPSLVQTCERCGQRLYPVEQRKAMEALYETYAVNRVEVRFAQRLRALTPEQQAELMEFAAHLKAKHEARKRDG